MRQLLILIQIALVMTFGCQNRRERNMSASTNNPYYHDVGAFKAAFDLSGDSDRILLFKDFDLDSKDYNEMVEYLGNPVQEYMDTFKYGLNEDEAVDLDRFQIWHAGNHHYYWFPDTFEHIDNLLIHKAIWPYGEKEAIVLYFTYDEEGDERPFWGYKRRYPPTNIPLWALSEKDLTLSQVLELRGLPQEDRIERYEYGLSEFGPSLSNIFALRDTPEAKVHEYKWIDDSDFVLRLYYQDCKDIMNSRPIWGIICTEDGFFCDE